MLLSVILYFSFLSMALTLLFFPGARAWAAHQGRRVAQAGRAASQAAAASGRSQLRSGGSRVMRTAADVLHTARGQGRWIALGTLALMAGPLIAIAARGLLELDAYDHTASRPVNAQVAALLHGEQLAPPSPLPPELFTTRELEQARPNLRHASRQWELLDAAFRQRLLVVFKLMRERHGYDMVLLEGFRSAQRQAQLAALGPQVTRAGAGRSYHQVGLAADLAFLRDGRIVISERDAWAARGYALYGDVARSVGLTWGGDWDSLRDLGHVELRRPGAFAAAADDEQHRH
jgi:peptidoglycan L-alanyl-D-glutamate endopeptidase CwlK